LKVKDRSESLHESPLFKIGGTPNFFVNELNKKLFIDSLFQKMIEEQETDYVFKDDLIRNYINLILHESMKNAAVRELF
jgi:AraC family transcriptional activator of pobA